MAILLTSLADASDLCVVQGIGAGKYADLLLKASGASYADGLAQLAL